MFDLYALEHNGRKDLLDFLIDLKASSVQQFRKLTKLLDRTVDFGLIKNEEMFKRLTVDIYEFKTHGGVRVLCFIDGRSIIVLTNGFKKRKKYDDELVKANNLRVTYLSEKMNNTLERRNDQIA